MKHKLIAIFLVVLLLTQFSVVVSANEMNLQLDQNEKSKVIASYRTGNKMFSFLHFDGQLPEANKLTLNVSEEKRQAAESMLPVWNQSPAEITILVDTSIPMARYHDDLMLFAKSLINNGPKNLTVSVVTVKNVAEIAAGIQDWQTLNTTLEGLTYDGWRSDLCGSVSKVLNHIGAENHDDGAMLNLVVFSRCVGYYNDDGVKDAGERSAAAGLAAKAIQDHPEVIVHSVCVENSNTVEMQTLAMGKGRQVMVADSVSAANAGAEITDYLNDTWVAKFAGYDIEHLSLDNLFIRYQTIEDGSFVLHSLPMGIIADLKSIEQEPAEPSSDVEDNSIAPVETAASEETAVTEGTASSEEPTEDPAGSPTGETLVVEGYAVSDDFTGNRSNKPLLWLGISLGIIVILGIVITIAVSSSKRKSTAVVMRVVVEFGSVMNLRDRYYLIKSLTIGSGKDCDIIIPGAAVSPKNTRIFLDKNNIYVEDMNSERGTLIGGMRIFSPNRLRSGDVITVGNTSIRFLF